MMCRSLAALLMLAVAVYAAEWTSRHDGQQHGPDEAAAIALSPSGVPYAVGSEYGPDGSDDFVTIRYDPATGESTVATYSFVPESAFDDEATALAVSGSGYVFITGFSTYLNSGDSFSIPQYTSIRYTGGLTSPEVAHYLRDPDDDEAEACAHAIALRGDSFCITGENYYDDDRWNDITTVMYDPPASERLDPRRDPRRDTSPISTRGGTLPPFLSD